MSILISTLSKPTMLAALVSIGLGGAAAQASDVAKCKPLRASAPNLVIASDIGPVLGPVEFKIGGKTVHANVIVNLLAAPEEQPDGSLRSFARLDYTFADGSTLTGITIGTQTPTGVPGVFNNDQQVTYVDGSGNYEGVFGRILATGTLDFVNYTAAMQGVGAVCKLTNDDDDED